MFGAKHPAVSLPISTLAGMRASQKRFDEAAALADEAFQLRYDADQFETPGTMWEGNVDFKFRALGEKFDWVYIGSGLNIHRQSIPGNDLTRAGWNLIAGAESIRGKVHPFGEVRVTVTDNTRFQVQAGIKITLGKS